MKAILKFIVLYLAFLDLACASAGNSKYFRMWQGFRSPNLSQTEFLDELPAFMSETVELYQGSALNNYIVIIPPVDKPDFIPDELALVGLSSESEYRSIRQTPAGQEYSRRHWDVFDQNTSESSKHFIDYSSEQPQELQNNWAYDMIGEPIDWTSGFNVVFIGTRKDGVTPHEFLSRLKTHLEMAKTIMKPRGLRGYIVIANENYEIAYLNWHSKVDHDEAGQTDEGQSVFVDAAEFMDVLMYEEAQSFQAGNEVTTGKAYSTLQYEGEKTVNEKNLKKALIVVTSHSRLGETGKLTGYYLPEVTHPYFEFVDSGLEVDIASPTGGNAPMDESSRDLDDPVNQRFLNDKQLVSKLENTLALTDIDPNQYDAVLFAGGHGTMWDFPQSGDINRISTAIYERGGVVSAVCHGPAALLNIEMTNGELLIKNKRVTGFTNSEEAAAQLTDVMPFLLETELERQGANFVGKELWQENVVVDERLVTGQNPASAKGVAQKVLELLKVSDARR